MYFIRQFLRKIHVCPIQSALFPLALEETSLSPLSLCNTYSFFHTIRPTDILLSPATHFLAKLCPNIGLVCFQFDNNIYVKARNSRLKFFTGQSNYNKQQTLMLTSWRQQLQCQGNKQFDDNESVQF